MKRSTTTTPQVLLVGPNPFEPRKSMWLFVECLAEALPAVGFEPHLLRPRFPRLGRLGASRAIRAMLRLVLEAAQIRHAARAVDLIHVGDHASAFHLLGCGLESKPKVVTCHDVFFIASTLRPDTDTPRRDRWWQGRTLRGIARAQRIACASRPTEIALHKLFAANQLDPAPISLLPVGLLQSLPIRQDNELAAALRLLDPRLRPGSYVVHVGGNFARKNRAQVVAAFAAFGPAHGLRLVLAGEPPNAALCAAIARHAIGPHLTIASGVSAAQLGSLYQGAFALLFPSRAEGFGLPPIEAQTLDCPVVASDIPPHRENLDGSALLAGADDTGALVACLEALLAPETRRRQIERGRSNARQFSRETMIQRYAALYRELLAPT